MQTSRSFRSDHQIRRSFKVSRQLWVDSPEFTRMARKRLNFFRARRTGAVASRVEMEEFEKHMRNMPDSYWARVTEDELTRHLGIIHSYLVKMSCATGERPEPAIHWTHFPERGCSEVLICAMDQHGLLAKIAGAFAESGINVFNADIFTRKDGVVLDIFQVCDTEFRAIENMGKIGEMQKRLNDSLRKHADLPFGSSFDKSDEPLSTTSALNRERVPIMVAFDNERSPAFTIIQIQTPDYLGLLHDILQVLSLCDVDIQKAVINTEKELARDVFYVTDFEGGKLTSSDKLEIVRSQLVAMILQRPCLQTA